jgi:hypothetical protein
MSDSFEQEQVTSAGTTLGPTVRVRTKYSRLVKTGWQFESSVEVHFTAIDHGEQFEPAMQTLNEHGVTGTQPWTQGMTSFVLAANRLAQLEVERLNALDVQNEEVTA